jgi:hypothetical protein
MAPHASVRIACMTQELKAGDDGRSGIGAPK